MARPDRSTSIATPESAAPPLLTEHQAAAWLGYTPRFLQKRRLLGTGPAYVRVSATSIRYRVQDVEAWAESLIVASTSDPGPRAA